MKKIIKQSIKLLLFFTCTSHYISKSSIQKFLNIWIKDDHSIISMFSSLELTKLMVSDKRCDTYKSIFMCGN